MECRTLEITLIFATDLEDVNVDSKMNVDAVVIINGEPQTKQKIPVNKDCGSNSKWNYTMKFTAEEAAANQKPLDLVICLVSDRLFGDIVRGNVLVPINGYIDREEKSSFSVTLPKGKVKGILNLCCKIGEKFTVPPGSAPPHETEKAKSAEKRTGYPVVKCSTEYSPQLPAAYPWNPPPQVAYQQLPPQVAYQQPPPQFAYQQPPAEKRTGYPVVRCSTEYSPQLPGAYPWNPPPQVAYQQPPPQVAYQQPPPQVAYQQPPPQFAYQQPPPPPQFAYQQPPPQFAYQQPPPQFAYQQPPPQFTYQQPPPQFAYQQPPPQFAYQQPPPQFTYQQPPPQFPYQQPPPQFPYLGLGQGPPSGLMGTLHVVEMGTETFANLTDGLGGWLNMEEWI